MEGLLSAVLPQTFVFVYPEISKYIPSHKFYNYVSSVKVLKKVKIKVKMKVKQWCYSNHLRK